MSQSFLCAQFISAECLSDPTYDGVILISHSVNAIEQFEPVRVLKNVLLEYLKINKAAKDCSSMISVDKIIIPSGRLIYAGTGPVIRDQDDIRRFMQAARSAIKLALRAGVKAPLIVTIPHSNYPNAEIVSALGILQEIYVPLNIREEEKDSQKVSTIGFLGLKQSSKDLVRLITAFDAAFIVCRDVGDSDPQRMAPPRVAEYIQSAFKGSSVKVHITADEKELKREFPMLAAVNRAANAIEEHKARLIWLEYIPSGPIDETIMLVGKGVTIDTGGADVKTNGAMFGMSRDKYGSAVVAGIFKALQVLAPKRVKFVGYMCMVRNSIGSNSYTCDEIIRCRSGKRIHIYNTDAEGRLTMLDPLTKMREMALLEKNPSLFTLATLTGHCVLAYGYMPAAMENGPARRNLVAIKLRECGDSFGQPLEISRLHSEDYSFHEAECESADLRQGNTKPSVQTLRGHQTPAAFLIQASRLDEHGCDSNSPISYTHIDIGEAMGEYPHVSFPNPLVAFVATFVLPRAV